MAMGIDMSGRERGGITEGKKEGNEVSPFICMTALFCPWKLRCLIVILNFYLNSKGKLKEGKTFLQIKLKESEREVKPVITHQSSE